MARRVPFAGLVFALVLFAAGCDWAMVGYDATRSGYSPETTITPANVGTLTQKWTAQLPSTAASDPVVAGGKLFVTASPTATVTTGALQAFDAAGATSCTGTPVVCTPLWSAPYAPNQYETDGQSLSSPAVSGSDVYVGTLNLQPLTEASSLDAYTTASGAAVFTALHGGLSSPAVTGAAAGCGTATCSPTWSATAGSQSLTSPAVAGSVLFVGSADGHLYAFPAKGCGNTTCAATWTASLGSAADAVSVAGSVVYVTTSDGHLDAFNTGGCGQATCNALVSIAVGDPVDTAPAISSGRVFVTDTTGTVRAYGLP